LYATGSVSADTRNIGGVVGYGYTGTEIRNVVALNPAVHAPSYAHRVLGRVLSGHTATLENLWAADFVDAQTTNFSGPVGPTTWMGATATNAQVRDANFYTETLEWDLESTWQWHDDAARPVLRAIPENYTGEPVPPVDAEQPDTPAEEEQPEEGLERDEDGYLLITQASELAEVTAQPDEN